MNYKKLFFYSLLLAKNTLFAQESAFQEINVTPIMLDFNKGSYSEGDTNLLVIKQATYDRKSPATIKMLVLKDNSRFLEEGDKIRGKDGKWYKFTGKCNGECYIPKKLIGCPTYKYVSLKLDVKAAEDKSICTVISSSAIGTSGKVEFNLKIQSAENCGTSSQLVTSTYIENVTDYSFVKKKKFPWSTPKFVLTKNTDLIADNETEANKNSTDASDEELKKRKIKIKGHKNEEFVLEEKKSETIKIEVTNSELKKTSTEEGSEKKNTSKSKKRRASNPCDKKGSKPEREACEEEDGKINFFNNN
jgi:hypothetical protein